MALKVAELFAELGIDTKNMTRDVDKAVTTSSRSLRQIVDAADKAGLDAGKGLADGVEKGAEGAGGKVESRFRADTSGLADAGRQRGREAGDAVGGGILDGMPDLSGGIGGILDDALGGLPPAVAGPALAVGAAAGAAIVSGMSTALEQGRIESRFEAALGANEATAAKLGEMAGDIYAANFGESMEQVAESVRLVGQNFAGVADLSESELAKVNQYALNTANVFDQDLRMVINAVSQLMRTGLAKNAEEAFDIITRGLQLPANKADDLLETFNEYSTLFREMGLTGEQSLGLINQMVEAGARDADKAADAIAEFSKRARDASDTTAVGFQAIGLNAADMAERVSAGGTTAADALDETLDRLRMLDGAAQEQAGVALFGTQWEDLGDAILAADLDRATIQLGQVDGAAQRAADSFDDMGSKVDTMFRQLQTELGQTFEDWLAPLAVAADDDATWEEAGKAIAGGIERGMSLVPFSDILGAWADRAGLMGNNSIAENVTDWFFGSNAPEAPDRLRDILADVQAARNEPPLDFEINADASGAVASLDQVNELLTLSGELADIAAQRGQMYLDRLGETSQLGAAISSQLNLRDATKDLVASLGNLKGVDISDFADGLIQVSDEAAAALGNIDGAASAAQQQIADTLTYQGDDAAITKAGELRDRFVGVFDAAGMTDQQIIELLGSMGLLPDQVETAIELSGADEAMAKLTLIRDFMMNEDGTSGIPKEIEAQVALAVSEGRAVDALNLVQTYLDDKQDGMIDNPLLIQMGLGDTEPASGEVEGWKSGEEAKPPVRVPVAADTSPARAGIAGLLRDIGLLRPTVLVGTKIQLGADRLAMGAVISAEKQTGQDLNGNGVIGKAMGGPIIGPGGPTDDMIPAMLSNGEWVINAAASKALGPEVMAMVNAGRLPVSMPSDMRAAAAQASAAGGSSVSMAEVSALASSVDTLAREVARKGDTINVTTADPAAVPRHIGRAKRASAWSRGVG